MLIEVLTPSECDLIWRQGGSLQKQSLKWGLWRWIHVHHDWHPDKKGFGHRDTHKEKTAEETTGKKEPRGLNRPSPHSRSWWHLDFRLLASRMMWAYASVLETNLVPFVEVCGPGKESTARLVWQKRRMISEYGSLCFPVFELHPLLAVSTGHLLSPLLDNNNNKITVRIK